MYQFPYISSIPKIHLNTPNTKLHNFNIFILFLTKISSLSRSVPVKKSSYCFWDSCRYVYICPNSIFKSFRLLVSFHLISFTVRYMIICIDYLSILVQGLQLCLFLFYWGFMLNGFSLIASSVLNLLLRFSFFFDFDRKFDFQADPLQCMVLLHFDTLLSSKLIFNSRMTFDA